MILPRTRFFRIVIMAGFLSTSLLVWYLFSLGQFEVIDTTRFSGDNILLFPNSFRGDILDFTNENFDLLKVRDLQGIRAKRTSDLRYQQDLQYKDHVVNIYNTAKNIKGQLSRCTNELLSQLKIRISKAELMQKSIRPMLQMIIDGIDSGNDHYLRTISPFFIDNLRQSLKEKTYWKYWTKFTGSSVFLEDYGVHFSISRIVYFKNKETLVSLVYAELYDANWKEVKYTLAVPSNDPEFESDDRIVEQKQEYTLLEFPRFIHVPFMQNEEGTEGKYFGPEDAHVTLVKNENGHEEPLLFFNLLHKSKKDVNKDDKTPESKEDSENVRSIFIAFPFQFQKGKANVEGKPEPEFNQLVYTKTFELTIPNKQREKVEKNWIPLLDSEERRQYGYDKYIYFIHRWHDLAILKCDLQGICENEFDTPQFLAAVGALRGGSQLVNVNDVIIKAGGDVARTIIPKGRQVWIGFPRAHISNCGCVTAMYRPNLAIVVRDETPDGKRVYKVSHVSSSIDFDLPVFGWDLSRPKEVCLGPNVLLSNGISLWNVESFKKIKGKLITKDYMTLMLSIGDYTIHTLHVEGLLDIVLNLDGPSLFNNTEKSMSLPDLLVLQRLVGYNSENVECAVYALTQYCATYEQMFMDFSSSHPEEVEKFINEAIKDKIDPR